MALITVRPTSADVAIANSIASHTDPSAIGAAAERLLRRFTGYGRELDSLDPPI